MTAMWIVALVAWGLVVVCLAHRTQANSDAQTLRAMGLSELQAQVAMHVAAALREDAEEAAILAHTVRRDAGELSASLMRLLEAEATNREGEAMLAIHDKLVETQGLAREDQDAEVDAFMEELVESGALSAQQSLTIRLLAGVLRVHEQENDDDDHTRADTTTARNTRASSRRVGDDEDDGENEDDDARLVQVQLNSWLSAEQHAMLKSTRALLQASKVLDMRLLQTQLKAMFFKKVFRGIGRAVKGVARGVGRAVVAVGRKVGKVAGAVVKGVSKVAGAALTVVGKVAAPLAAIAKPFMPMLGPVLGKLGPIGMAANFVLSGNAAKMGSQLMRGNLMGAAGTLISSTPLGGKLGSIVGRVGGIAGGIAGKLGGAGGVLGRLGGLAGKVGGLAGRLGGAAAGGGPGAGLMGALGGMSGRFGALAGRVGGIMNRAQEFAGKMQGVMGTGRFGSLMSGIQQLGPSLRNSLPLPQVPPMPMQEEELQQEQQQEQQPQQQFQQPQQQFQQPQQQFQQPQQQFQQPQQQFQQQHFQQPPMDDFQQPQQQFQQQHFQQPPMMEQPQVQSGFSGSQDMGGGPAQGFAGYPGDAQQQPYAMMMQH